MRIEPNEVRPGLVAHLDPQVLRDRGGSATNAEATATEDRSVQGEHELLVVLVNEANGPALAVPLFSS